MTAWRPSWIRPATDVAAGFMPISRNARSNRVRSTTNLASAAMTRNNATWFGAGPATVPTPSQQASPCPTVISPPEYSAPVPMMIGNGNGGGDRVAARSWAAGRRDSANPAPRAPAGPAAPERVLRPGLRRDSDSATRQAGRRIVRRSRPCGGSGPDSDGKAAPDRSRTSGGTWRWSGGAHRWRRWCSPRAGRSAHRPRAAASPDAPARRRPRPWRCRRLAPDRPTGRSGG